MYCPAGLVEHDEDVVPIHTKVLVPSGSVGTLESQAQTSSLSILSIDPAVVGYLPLSI